jgi:hypothetical protein
VPIEIAKSAISLDISVIYAEVRRLTPGLLKGPSRRSGGVGGGGGVGGLGVRSLVRKK